MLGAKRRKRRGTIRKFGLADMEMTGLDPETCVPIEIATIITDSQLNILAEVRIYDQPASSCIRCDGRMEYETPWCSGLSAPFRPRRSHVRRL